MLRKWINVERFIHSIKTVIAVTLGIALTSIISYRSSQWVVITILVVMCAQVYVGSVLQKSFLRLVGTLVGCFFATIAIMFFGDSPLSIFVWVCLSSFIFSYISSGDNLSYAGTLGAVTTALILLGQLPTAQIAGERCLEISVGLLIATLVSQFVLPIHARAHLRRAQADTLEKLRDYYIAVTKSDNTSDFHDLEEAIVASLLNQRQLAKESKNEPLESGFNQAHFIESLSCERDILRAITFMQSAATHLNQTRFHLFQQPEFVTFNNKVVNTLNMIIDVIDQKKAPGVISIDGVNELKDCIERHLGAASREELLYIDGLLFSAESLADSLKKLSLLYQCGFSKLNTPEL